MKELHLICNAHIDPVWQWDWEEGLGVTVSTFKQAADFCDEYDYVFCHNESILYEYIEKVDPELFARIQKLVKTRQVGYRGRLVFATRHKYALRRSNGSSNRTRQEIFCRKVRGKTCYCV